MCEVNMRDENYLEASYPAKVVYLYDARTVLIIAGDFSPFDILARGAAHDGYADDGWEFKVCDTILAMETGRGLFIAASYFMVDVNLEARLSYAGKYQVVWEDFRG